MRQFTEYGTIEGTYVRCRCRHIRHDSVGKKMVVKNEPICMSGAYSLNPLASIPFRRKGLEVLISVFSVDVAIAEMYPSPIADYLSMHTQDCEIHQYSCSL